MVYGSEKPTTRRSRIVTMAVAWVVVGIPLTVGMWLFMGWWMLLPLAVVVWATVDYIRKGGSGIDHFWMGW
jgi:hypothetical protein